MLTETYTGNGAVTTFTVDPEGERSRLRIETSWPASRGIAGLVERFIAPRLLGRLYRDEFDLIERWATGLRSPGG